MALEKLEALQDKLVDVAASPKVQLMGGSDLILDIVDVLDEIRDVCRTLAAGVVVATDPLVHIPTAGLPDNMSNRRIQTIVELARPVSDEPCANKE